MTSRTPDWKKARVIKLWVAGNSDNIANLTNLSGGTVTNIIDEWKERVGSHDADVTRELAVDLKKRNLKLADILPSIRLFNIIKECAIDAEKVESFVISIQKRGIAKGISPETVVNFEQALRISESEDIDPASVPEQVKPIPRRKMDISDSDGLQCC